MPTDDKDAPQTCLLLQWSCSHCAYSSGAAQGPRPARVRGQRGHALQLGPRGPTAMLPGAVTLTGVSPRPPKQLAFPAEDKASAGLGAQVRGCHFS